MAKRKARLTGTFHEDGQFWFRLSERAARQGPFATLAECDRAYVQACNRRVVRSAQARGNRRFARF